jgi:hypothetical protein
MKSSVVLTEENPHPLDEARLQVAHSVGVAISRSRVPASSDCINARLRLWLRRTSGVPHTLSHTRAQAPRRRRRSAMGARGGIS